MVAQYLARLRSKWRRLVLDECVPIDFRAVETEQVYPLHRRVYAAEGALRNMVE